MATKGQKREKPPVEYFDDRSEGSRFKPLHQAGPWLLMAGPSDEHGIRVIALVDLQDPGSPRVVELTFTTRDPQDKSLIDRLLTPVNTDQDIRVAALRGVSIGEIESAARQRMDAVDALAMHTMEFIDWCLTHGYGVGQLRTDGYEFRLDRDRAAAVRRVIAAWIYAYYVSTPDKSPLSMVEEILNLNSVAARSLVQQARRSGYLTPGRPGKEGGDMTENGIAFLQTCLSSWNEMKSR